MNRLLELKSHSTSVEEIKDLQHWDLDTEHRIRVYTYAPGNIAIQIRNYGPIAMLNKKAKPRMMVGHATLTLTQAKELVAILQATIEDCEST